MWKMPYPIHGFKVFFSLKRIVRKRCRALFARPADLASQCDILGIELGERLRTRASAKYEKLRLALHWVLEQRRVSGQVGARHGACDLSLVLTLQMRCHFWKVTGASPGRELSWPRTRVRMSTGSFRANFRPLWFLPGSAPCSVIASASCQQYKGVSKHALADLDPFSAAETVEDLSGECEGRSVVDGSSEESHCQSCERQFGTSTQWRAVFLPRGYTFTFYSLRRAVRDQMPDIAGQYAGEHRGRSIPCLRSWNSWQQKHRPFHIMEITIDSIFCAGWYRVHHMFVSASTDLVKRLLIPLTFETIFGTA